MYERPREIAYEIRNRVATGIRRAAKNPIVNEVGTLVVGAAGATVAAVGTSIAKNKNVSENVSHAVGLTIGTVGAVVTPKEHPQVRNFFRGMAGYSAGRLLLAGVRAIPRNAPATVDDVEAESRRLIEQARIVAEQAAAAEQARAAEQSRPRGPFLFSVPADGVVIRRRAA